MMIIEVLARLLFEAILLLAVLLIEIIRQLGPVR